MTLAFVAVMKLAKRCNSQKAQQTSKRLLLFFFTCVYTSLATMCIKTFQSVEGAFFYDSRISFSSTAHRFVMIFAGALLMFVVLGVPISMAYFTRSLLHNDLLRDTKTRESYGAYYDAFTDAHVDFESYSLLRRGFAVMVVVQARKEPIAQAALQLLISLWFLRLVYGWRPYAPSIYKLHCCRRWMIRLDTFARKCPMQLTKYGRRMCVCVCVCGGGVRFC